MSSYFRTALLAMTALTASCTATSDPSEVTNNQKERHSLEAIWPETTSPLPQNDALEARAEALLAQMTLRQKVGQIIQADIGSITPADLETYPLGALLNGGNSAPNGDNRSDASDWLALADAFYDATQRTDLGGGPYIPLLWGTDAVHGHNNIPGATIFPHNIGLGATNNPDLLHKIGDITAREIRITGQEWTFAPTIAVVRDDRWGRTYEGYSEAPAITGRFAGPLITGIQGDANSADFLKGDNVISTAKHFLGDGGTVNGVDQGQNIDSEADLYRIHGAAYPKAIEAGVQVVMASYNSWNDKKLHGHEYLLTDVLKGQMSFDGFVVGDWNGHGQIEGCTPTDCAAALHAGLDMYMAPDSWKDLFETTLAQAETGEINMDRLDDAVRRILRVKLRAGLFEAGRPSSRPFAGRYELLGDAQSKAVARQAVQESAVLLKNDGVLPIAPNSNVLLLGDGADNIGKQSGGWTFSWQGTGNSNADFRNGSSYQDRLETLLSASGGALSRDLDAALRGASRPDVAVIVFGEDPYAEFIGDREDLAYRSKGDADLKTLLALQEAGIPTVSVFLTGRPLWVNRELNASNAFVVAWLPGSEGGYGADLLIANDDGAPRHDFIGKLSYSWPKMAMQTPLNVEDEGYDPLFAYGYGLTYADEGDLGRLSEEAGISLDTLQTDSFILAGEAVFPWEFATSGNLGQRKIDGLAQEDTLELTFNGESTLTVSGPSVDLSRKANGDMAVSLHWRVPVNAAPGDITLSVGCESAPCETSLSIADLVTPSEIFTRTDIKLSCFTDPALLADVNRPLSVSASSGQLHLISAEIVSNEGQAICP